MFQRRARRRRTARRAARCGADRYLVIEAPGAIEAELLSERDPTGKLVPVEPLLSDVDPEAHRPAGQERSAAKTVWQSELVEPSGATLARCSTALVGCTIKRPRSEPEGASAVPSTMRLKPAASGAAQSSETVGRARALAAVREPTEATSTPSSQVTETATACGLPSSDTVSAKA